MPPSVTTYEFLSEEWLEAAASARHASHDPSSPVMMTMNLTVTEAPFTSETIAVSLDTTKGVLALARGNLASADVTIRVDWSTAKTLLLEGDTSAAMSAFMAGKVTVEGDMAKLLALRAAPLDARSREVVERLRAITT